MNRLIGELLRRHVLRVAAAYLVTGWLIMQVVSIITPALNLPDWVDGFFAVLLIAGFLDLCHPLAADDFRCD